MSQKNRPKAVNAAGTARSFRTTPAIVLLNGVYATCVLKQRGAFDELIDRLFLAGAAHEVRILTSRGRVVLVFTAVGTECL